MERYSEKTNTCEAYDKFQPEPQDPTARQWGSPKMPADKYEMLLRISDYPSRRPGQLT